MELVRDSGIRHQLVSTAPGDDTFCAELRADPARYAGQVLYCFAEVAGAPRGGGEPADV